MHIAELRKRRADIDAEIARLESGDLKLLDQTAVKDRFQQFVAVARELLADFREVEQNFRLLDRSVRERIALWQRSKGVFLEKRIGSLEEDWGRCDGHARRLEETLKSKKFKETELKKNIQDCVDRKLAAACPRVVRSLGEPIERCCLVEGVSASGHICETVNFLSLKEMD